MRPDVARWIRSFAPHWRLLIGAAVAQALVACALRVVSLPRLRNAGRRMHPVIAAVLPGKDDRVVWAIEATGRRLAPVSTCLVRALVGEMRLASSERSLQLVIGVIRTEHGALRSHAWLCDRERVLIGGPVDHKYSPIVQWESAA
jgi:hypothetical protein